MHRKPGLFKGRSKMENLAFFPRLLLAPLMVIMFLLVGTVLWFFSQYFDDEPLRYSDVTTPVKDMLVVVFTNQWK